MTTPRADMQLRLLIVGEGQSASELAEGLGKLLPECNIVVTDSATAAVARAATWKADGTIAVPVVALISAENTPRLKGEPTPGDGNIDQIIGSMSATSLLENTRYLLCTERFFHDDISESVDNGRFSAVISAPWDVGIIAAHARAEISRWVTENRDRLGGGWEEPAGIFAAPFPDDLTDASHEDILTALEKNKSELIREFLEAVEEVLGKRPRLSVAAGKRLTRQGEPLDAVYLVLEGKVVLERTSGNPPVTTVTNAEGNLIGLVSLTHPEGAHFTSVAASQCRVVRLSIEQLERSLLKSSEVSALLAAVTIQSLTQRLVVMEAMRVEKEELALRLEDEHARLRQALQELSDTRGQLVQQARFATLGELAAGIAHELNNPVAALQRAAEFMSKDMDALLHTDARLAPAQEALERSLSQERVSTKEERQLVRAFAEHVGGDRELARRLVSAGITDPETARALGQDPQALRLVEAGASLGSSLRNVALAADRITELVNSLRSYARSDVAPTAEVDLNAIIDDTLRLMSHKMRGVEVERAYGDIPAITCFAGKISQVITNLLVNAAESLQASGVGGAAATAGAAPTVEVRTSTGVSVDVDAEATGVGGSTALRENGEAAEIPVVVVEVIDNGIGISPENQEKIFQPHFSTKSGTVRFGLGMGLGMSRQIAASHGGTLTVESTPGHTVFRLALPVNASILESNPGVEETETAPPAPNQNKE